MTTPLMLTAEEFVTQVTWQKSAIPLASLVEGLALPLIVKLETGLYGNLGASQLLDTDVPYLLHSHQRERRVTGANLMWDRELRDFVEKGSALSIPAVYSGWWKPMSPPHRDSTLSALTREGVRTRVAEVAAAGVRAFLAATDVTCIQAPCRGASLKSHLKVMIPPGETFLVSGVYVDKVSRRSRATRLLSSLCSRSRKDKDVTTKVMYLQCATTYGQELLIPFDTEAKFYRIGVPGTCDPHCVYQIQTLQKMIPESGLLVKLIHGKPPKGHDNFSGLVRLQSVIIQEAILACTICELTPRLLEFPLGSSLFFICASKQTAEVGAMTTEAFSYMDKTIEDYLSRIKVVQKVTDSVKPNFCQMTLKRNLPPLPKSTSSPDIADQVSIGETFITESDFSDTEDYAVIPHDDPLYQNQHHQQQEEQQQQQQEQQQQYFPQSNYIDQTTFLSPNDTGVVYTKPKRSTRHSNKTEAFVDADGYLQPHPPNRFRYLHNGYGAGASNEGFSREESLCNCDTNSGSHVSRGSQARQRQTKKSLGELKSHTDGSSNQQGFRPYKSSGSRTGRSAVGNRMNGELDNDVFVCDTRNGPVEDNRLENFLVDAIKQMKMQNCQGPEQVESDSSQEDGESLDERLSIQSGAVCVSAQPELDRVSDLSSLYKQVKSVSHADLAPAARRPHTRDSGVGETPRCSDSSAGDTTLPRGFLWSASRDSWSSLNQDSWLPPDDISSLTVEEVGRSLRYIGLKPKLVLQFLEEQIDGVQLCGLDKALLKEGFPALNALDLKKIMDFKQGWRPKR